MNILKLIAVGLTALIIAVSGHYPQVVPQAHQALGAFNPTAGGTYRLNSSIGSTDTTIKLSSFLEPVSNTPYTMAYLNSSIAYGTLDPQNPTRTELISFTGITQNSDGTALLTGVTRGVSRSYPYAASSTFALSHAGQSIFILSDSPQVFAQYTSKSNNEVITGLWSFPAAASSSNPLTLGQATSTFVDFSSSQTITGNKYFSTSSSVTFAAPPVSGSVPGAQNQLANKAYVDSVAIAGAPNASTSAKGIVQEATLSEVQAGTGTGTTGARLYVSPSVLVPGLASSYALPISFSQFSSSTPTGSTTVYTITSTSSTQRVSVWVKGYVNSGGGGNVIALTYATSTSGIVIDSEAVAGTSGNFPFILLASFVPAATGTVQFVNLGGNAVSSLQAITELTTK